MQSRPNERLSSFDAGAAPAGTSAALPSTTLLSVDNLRTYFRSKRGIVHAVDGVSFDIQIGETLALVGETGSGKTVSARSLLRLLPSPPAIYSSGQALFQTGGPCSKCLGESCSECHGSGRDFIDLLTLSERELRKIRGNRIAMVFQDPGRALNPAVRIRNQLAEVFTEHRAQELVKALGTDVGWVSERLARGQAPAVLRQITRLPPWRRSSKRLRHEIDERIANALAETDIANPIKVMQSYPHELSGGMRQRVMIAQALACNPDLLVADEPTTALDVTVQARILDLITELQHRRRTAVLYVSHDLSLVRQIADRVAVMYAGRLAEMGPAHRIFDSTLHPYTQGLLDAIPDKRSGGKLQPIPGTVPTFLHSDSSCRFESRCPWAGPVCREFTPPLSDSIHAGHHVACFAYHNAYAMGVPSSDMPTKVAP